MSTTLQKSDTIPQRSDIDEKHKWDLSGLYRDDAEWEADFARAKELIAKAKMFEGKLSESADTLYECLETRTEVSRLCDDLYQYARFNQDLDNRVSKYQEMTERAAVLSSQASAEFSFVEPELLKMEDDKLRELSEKFAEPEKYDFYIHEVIRSRPHIRSAEVEEVLSKSTVVSRGADSIFTMLDNADIKYPSIKDEKGSEVRLTKQRYAKFMESSDQRVRRDANDGFLQVYKDHINTIASTLSTAINRDVFYASVRSYESSLHHALDAFNIPIEVYHSLLDTTEANLEGLHKYFEVRKRILKLERQFPYDIYCHLFPDQNYEVGYDEAVSEVLEATRPLGSAYGDVLQRAFENRWVDVWETEGKRGGAYSWGNYRTHPRVLMNYNETVNDMFTLAHEMGHAMHSYLSNEKQPYTKHQYSIFVAEVASTLNEGLLLQHLLKKADDPGKKLFLLNRQLANTMGTFFMQILFARFELLIHQIVEKGDALSPDSLNQNWEELVKKYYGPSVEIDEYLKYRWARIPHFYMTYYVYQYATSYAASQGILKKFLDGEEGIIERYLELLSSGGSDYPINQLKTCGVDMTTPGPVKDALDLFAQQVDQLEELSGA